jgi:hypothetical protein
MNIQKNPLIKRDFSKVRVKGVEPPRLAALDPKSSASTNSAIPAKGEQIYYFLTFNHKRLFKDFLFQFLFIFVLLK